MSTINYTYNVIVDRFRQFADGHFQLRRFTHGEISQADLEKEAEWPWMHVKPRAINYSPGTRAFSFEIFISDLPRDKEDKTGYQAESITDCSLIFQDLINEIHLGQMFGDDVVLTRPVNSEPFVEQYTHTLTGVTGIIELSLDYDWSACSIPASWNYNTPTDSPSDGWGALQFIESLDQNGVFVSLLNDLEAPGNSYYYGTNASGVKGWYAIVDNIGLTCETLPDCPVIIGITEDIVYLLDTIALKANTADLGATAFSNDYNDLDNLPTIPAAQVNSDWNATSGVAEILNKPTLPATVGDMLKSVYDTDVDGVVDSAERIQIVVRNSTGSTLTKGQIVYLSGATGNRPNAVLAQANTEATSSKTIGMVIANIANNADGQVAVNGTLHDLDTSAFTAGDTLWLSATTAGGMVANTPPIEPNHAVFIGYVARSHPNQGRVVLAIQNGYELNELHGVLITSPANNNVLAYTSATDIWENKTVATALGYTPVPSTRSLTINGTTQDLSADRTFTIATGLTVGTTPITSGAVGRVLFEGTGNVLQESANLTWDNSNGRLTVGTSTGASRLNFPDAGTTAADGIAFGSGANIFRNSSTGISIFSGSGTWQFNSAVLTLPTNQGSIIRMNPGRSLFIDNGTTFYLSVNGTTGNVLIGTTTDAGFKLDVNGTMRVIGATTLGTTSASNTTTIATSGSSNVLNVTNTAGTFVFGVDSAGGYAQPSTANRGMWFYNSSASAYIGAAASGCIAINTTSPNASAILDVTSTTKGVLFPRMTTTQKNAIASPASGLVVYDTTLGKLCVRGAAAWETITSV